MLKDDPKKLKIKIREGSIKREHLDPVFVNLWDDVQKNAINVNTLQELLNKYYSTMQNAISFKGDIEVIPAGETRDVGFTFDCINASGTVMLDIYKDGVQVAHHNATSFPYHFTISNGGTGLYRCEADVNGIKYVGLWDIKESYDFWIGTGIDYNTVLANPSYKHVGASSLSGTYFLNPNENDYIFIICRSNVVPASITMSGFDVPLSIAETITVEGVEYSVYQSANTYQQGSIEIKINDIQYDTDSYIAHLIEEVLSLKTKAEGIEEEVRTIADEETITVNDNNKVALKNRPMKRNLDTNEVIQKGYVILRETDDFKQVVESYTEGHVIFEIDYAFDLGGQSVTIPEGCTLKFEGGRISNGTLKLSSNCDIVGSPTFVNCRIVIHGTESNPIEGIKLENITLDGNYVDEVDALLHCAWVDNLKIRNLTIKNRYHLTGNSTCKDDQYSATFFSSCKNVYIDGYFANEGIYPWCFAMYWCENVVIDNAVIDDRNNDVSVTSSPIWTGLQIYFSTDVTLRHFYIYDSSGSGSWDTITLEQVNQLGSVANLACRNLLVEDSYFEGGKAFDCSNELANGIGSTMPTTWMPSDFDTTTIWSLSDMTLRKVSTKNALGISGGSLAGQKSFVVDNCNVESLVPHINSRTIGISGKNVERVVISNTYLKNTSTVYINENPTIIYSDASIRIDGCTYATKRTHTTYIISNTSSIVDDLPIGVAPLHDLSVVNCNIYTPSSTLLKLSYPNYYNVDSIIIKNNIIDGYLFSIMKNNAVDIGKWGTLSVLGNVIKQSHVFTNYTTYNNITDDCDIFSFMDNDCYRFAMTLMGTKPKKIVRNILSHNVDNTAIVKLDGAVIDNVTIESNSFLNVSSWTGTGTIYVNLDDTTDASAFSVGYGVSIKNNKAKMTRGTTVTTDDACQEIAYKSNQRSSTTYNPGEMTVGTDANKPIRFAYKGCMYFNTTLGKPIWWNGNAWVDEDGANLTSVIRVRGTKAQAEAMELTSANAGLKYYATDSNLNKYIMWNGTAWTNLDGTALS